MPAENTTRVCTICGDPVNGDCYAGVLHKHKECHKRAMRENRAENLEYYNIKRNFLKHMRPELNLVMHRLPVKSKERMLAKSAKPTRNTPIITITQSRSMSGGSASIATTGSIGSCETRNEERNIWHEHMRYRLRALR